MANNRLYLVDEDGDRILMAKGWGNGWVLWEPDELQEWLSSRDIDSATGYGPTGLKFKTDIEGD